jgi:phage baseplate assembly protein W
MAGLSPKLPIQRNKIDGYGLTKTYREMVAQNFKNLILTVPGERMMIPDFGVGLRKYLFELDSSVLYDKISVSIRNQTEKYMPFVEINELEFASAENSLYVIIEYSIIPLGVQDTLSIATSLEGVEV